MTNPLRVHQVQISCSSIQKALKVDNIMKIRLLTALFALAVSTAKAEEPETQVEKHRYEVSTGHESALTLAYNQP